MKEIWRSENYLDQLVDGYEETNLSIKGEPGLSQGCCMGCIAGKIIWNRDRPDFDLPISTLPLSDQHMVTLIGNLLSNSIEACEEWQKNSNEQGIITLQFYKEAGCIY